ncbi:suppressor protein SRP40-like [Rhodamnia argentea]|uniref:Suppressor protein SRP40-like n=1 Tax=Rhodamnia argentea TaxID=178133 RepID=A0A8B8NT09_9MYRT|nr:suppressor protein SRP40-like [Rhodamnia argentea]
MSKEDEPSIAPVPDRWYNISLGPSFGHHHPSSKFCTLRYEFKPASVDKNQPGLLRKKKDNRVSVEFQNNQHGKPKVVFDGVGEDYKDNDAVLFFDGETFRLERLHRAVKRLRHMRVPGESAAAVAVGPAVESSSPPDGNAANLQNFNKDEAQHMPVEVERIDMDNSEAVDLKPEDENTADTLPPSSSAPKGSTDLTNHELEAHLDIIDSGDGHEATKDENLSRREIHSSIDINVPHQDEDDDEIANVDVSDDEGNLGCDAAEALGAQVAGERREQSSTSSSSSESEGSDSSSVSSSDSGSRSGSGSSGSDSESSDGDSVTSI